MRTRAGTAPGTSAADWLAARSPQPPDGLRSAILAAVDRHDPGTGALGTRLAAAGLAVLERVAAGDGDRTSALELLAADALLTYAVEAAADEGGAALDALLDGLGVDRFQALLAGGGR